MIYPLDIPKSMFRAAENCARREGVTVNEWVLLTMAADIERHEQETDLKEALPEAIKKVEQYGYKLIHPDEEKN
ncbi:MAG: hypothetical protein IAE97_06310 [Chthoniobacterales bacterium]|nr:hypothetical protein [Chthoniobacterales bacterium]